MRLQNWSGSAAPCGKRPWLVTWGSHTGRPRCTIARRQAGVHSLVASLCPNICARSIAIAGVQPAPRGTRPWLVTLGSHTGRPRNSVARRQSVVHRLVASLCLSIAPARTPLPAFSPLYKPMGRNRSIWSTSQMASVQEQPASKERPGLGVGRGRKTATHS